MRKLIVLTLALLATGCAQFKAMSPEQKRVVVWTGVGAALVAGAIAAHDDDPDVTNVTNVWHEWEHHPHFCRKHCK